MSIFYSVKFRRRNFSTERRRVQRQIVQSVLLCGLVLIIFYALIVITTGIFIVYTQFFAPELIANLNNVQNHRLQVNENRMSERLMRDPVVRLLQSEEGVLNNDLQTFAPYEDYQSMDEAKQVENPATLVENFERSRLPFEFGLRRWVRSRKLLSVPSDDKASRKWPKHLACNDEPVAKTNASSEIFLNDLFTLSQRRHGAILLHICGLCYMFLALAYVCDEFFVPALSVLTQALDISDDVAGATFMAAAGSAPEFFTSMFGVFFTTNNLGVGTIVGSATFNILFVLSFCTFFSKAILHLTWWPLFRDMLFYVVALLLLLIFFMDEVVAWYEAAIMFGLYILYGIFMKYNVTIERVVKRRLMCRSASVGIDQKTLFKVDKEKNTSSNPNLNKHLPIAFAKRTLPVLHTGALFRTGIVNIAMDPRTLTGKSSDTKSLPDNQPDPSHSCDVRLDLSGLSSRQSHNCFVQAITRPNLLIRASLPHIGLPYAANQHGVAAEHGSSLVGNSSTPLQRSSSILSISTMISDSKSSTYYNSEPDRSKLKCSQTSNSTEEKSSTRFVGKLQQTGMELESEKPVDMSWPETFYKRCIFVLLAPITFSLYYTLPDVKNPTNKKLFLWTFSGSVLWIAFYSYLMVGWANTIGETVGLSSEIMGLTVLAAGTSIPDLITSVIVARKGFGDMAISSSIGSNLFDICVGLPVPWLLYYGLNMFQPNLKLISVESNGLICSLGMLFLMMIVLYGAVILFGWKMNKKFGLTMIIAYGLFCVLSVLLEVGYVRCPLKRLPIIAVTC